MYENKRNRVLYCLVLCFSYSMSIRCNYWERWKIRVEEDFVLRIFMVYCVIVIEEVKGVRKGSSEV